jgi:hypothetical protein
MKGRAAEGHRKLSFNQLEIGAKRFADTDRYNLLIHFGLHRRLKVHYLNVASCQLMTQGSYT